MWQDLTHGFNRANDSATEPLTTSSGLEFQVTPTFFSPQCSMIAFMLEGFCVPPPWTSTHTSTPASAADLAQGTSDLPICSSVFSCGTSFGNPLGLTFTPRAPRSRA